MMKRLGWVLAAATVSAASVSSAAGASYANNSIGLGIGAMTVRSDTIPIDFGVPVLLEYGHYLDNNFEFYFRGMFAFCNARGLGFAVGGGGQLGLRYLFTQESFRPWAGFHLSGIRAGTLAASGEMNGTALFTAAGAGVNAGIEYFVVESVTLGLRAYFDALADFTLATMVRFAPTIGGVLYVGVYF